MGQDITKIAHSKLFPGNASNSKDLRMKRYNPVHYSIQKKHEDLQDLESYKNEEFNHQNMENIPRSYEPNNNYFNFNNYQANKNGYHEFEPERTNQINNYPPIQPFNTYYQPRNNNNIYNQRYQDCSENYLPRPNTFSNPNCRNAYPGNNDKQITSPEPNRCRMANNRSTNILRTSCQINRNMSKTRFFQHQQLMSPLHNDKLHNTEYQNYPCFSEQDLSLQGANGRKTSFLDEYQRMNEFQNNNYSRHTANKNVQLRNYEARPFNETVKTFFR